MAQRELTARQVLEGAYQELLKKYSAKTVKLEKPISTREEVSWDPCKGTDYDVWNYQSVSILKVEDQQWGLALGEFGERGCDVIADCDILAFPATEDKIPDSLSGFEFCRLAIATTKGDLIFDDGYWVRRLLTEMRLEIGEHIQASISEKMKIDPKFINVEKLEIQLRRQRNSEEICKGTKLSYKKDTIQSVANFIETLLKRLS